MFDISSFWEASGPEPLGQWVTVLGHVLNVIRRAKLDAD
jgi:hypothetical protein